MARSLRILAAAFALCCAAAQAHQFHFGITDISFNQKTGSTEVVHTYQADDIEALLQNLYQRQFDLSQPEDEAALRTYVEKHFWIESADKRRLGLHWIGLKAGSETVEIYQEVENTPLSKAALIHDEVLIDFIAAQANTVNINEGGSIRSLSFDRKKIDQGVR
jgi:hypothetical protein